MIDVYLDGERLEVPQDISIGLSLGITDYSEPISASGAYTQTLDIPRTPRNEQAFKFSGEVLSAERFNQEEHTARIVVDGCEMVEGRAYLGGSTRKAYHMQVVGEEIGWVEAIRGKKMSELEGEAIGRFQPDEWSELLGDTAEMYPKLSFVMMQHGHWYQDTDDKPIRRTWATYNDLIPIVKLHTLLEHLFNGYTIEASGSLLKALHQTYVTMKWKSLENASVLAEDMGFEVTNKMLGADESGEVTATITANKGGKASLVMFDTIVEDKNGVLSTATDSDGTSVEFEPTSECAMALEINTRYQTSTVFYTTAFQDKDGGWDDVAMGNPSFADQLYANENADFPFVQFRIEDSLEWGAKTLLEQGDIYKNIYTRHTSSSFDQDLSPMNMPICYVEVDNPEMYESIGYIFDYYYMGNSTTSDDFIRKAYRPTCLSVSKRQYVRTNLCNASDMDGRDRYSLSITPALRGKDGLLYVYARPYTSYENAEGVKIYTLSDNQRLTFDVALKTPVAQYSPAYYHPINRIYFGSSTYPDKEITVYGTDGGSLKPSFEWGVPIREAVKLSDIGGDVNAEDMLRSIMQLYNLSIYTNPKTKRVHLYTFAELWKDDGGAVDWTLRVDQDAEMSLATLGDDIGKSVTLQYASGNARIDYYNDRHSLPYFAYKQALSTKIAKEDKDVANTLFTSAYMVKVADEFGGEGEGKIPAVAAKDSEGNVLDFNLADVPHTLVLIPEGEERADVATLPISTAVFGDVGPIQPPMSSAIDGVATLSFADKDGVEGLHKHYDKQIALWERARRLTCYCRIEPWEIEALRFNDESLSFRSLFLLYINGETINGRLESIEYEPTNSTNKCTFIIE